jgi:hypothetical protein
MEVSSQFRVVKFMILYLGETKCSARRYMEFWFYVPCNGMIKHTQSALCLIYCVLLFAHLLVLFSQLDSNFLFLSPSKRVFYPVAQCPFCIARKGFPSYSLEEKWISYCSTCCDIYMFLCCFTSTIICFLALYHVISP